MKKFTLVAFAALGASFAFGQELLTNPGWELGSTTGWTVVHAGGFSGVAASSTTWPANTGGFALHMGATSATDQTDIYQDVATTVGQSYTASFWAREMDTTPTGTMSITWGGVQIGPSSATVGAYTQYSLTAVATSAVTRFEITGWEAVSYVMNDDNSVQAAVPEPATFAAFGLGALGLALARRRRK